MVAHCTIRGLLHRGAWLVAWLALTSGVTSPLISKGECAEKPKAGDTGQSAPRPAKEVPSLLSWVGRLFLGKQFAQQMLVTEGIDDLELALHIHLAWANADAGEERWLEEVASRAFRRNRSLRKTYESLHDAIGGWEQWLASRYRGARLRVRLVTVGLTFRTVEVEPSEPMAIDLWDVFGRSDLPWLRRRLEGANSPGAERSPSEPPQGKPEGSPGRCTIGDLRKDQPVLILFRCRWVPIVEGKWAEKMSAEQLAREALRRVPPRGTVYMVYEVLPLKACEGEGGESIALETTKVELTWTPEGWHARRKDAACSPSHSPR